MIARQSEPVGLLPAGVEPELGAALPQSVVEGAAAARRGSAGRALLPRETDGVVHTVRLARLGHSERRVRPAAVPVRIQLDEIVRRVTAQYPLRQVPAHDKHQGWKNLGFLKQKK